jgi:DNA repair protein SbcD/Mre11
VPTFRPVPAARRVFDLDPIEASGRNAADIDQMIQERVEGIRGGLADQIVRLIVYNIPRHVGRELNHTTIRDYKAKALHFHLDLRRPDQERATGLIVAGQRQTLRQILTGYLHNRALPAELDRDAFQRLGVEVFDDVERDVAAR